LNVESLSIERMCSGKEFQVDGAETEKEHEEKWHPLVLLEDTCWRNVEFALERMERLAQTS